MTCLDLCCGRGGWSKGFVAEGYRVEGVDVVDFEDYPGLIWLRDVTTVTAREVVDRIGVVDVVVASPPCQEYSRHSMPWTRARNPVQPDLRIWQSCVRLAADLGAWCVVENVRGAQLFHGPAKASAGPWYFWGDVPALVGYSWSPPKSRRTSSAVAERAELPLNVTRWFARCFSRPTVRPEVVP